MKNKANNCIQVNEVRELNDNQLEIIITGVNKLRNDYVKEILEATFNIIKNGECFRCPVASPLSRRCVCYFQEGDD